MIGVASAGTGAGSMFCGATLQYLLDQVGLQWTLCIEAIILLSGIICGIILIPGPTSDLTQESPATFNCDLLRKPSYILFCIALTLFAYGYYVPSLYLPDYAMSQGIGRQKSANLISVIGFANLTSRLIFGFIGDHGQSIRFYLSGASLICLGLISVLLPLFHTYYMYLFYASLFGICVGCYISLLSVVLVDLFGLRVIEQAVGQAMAISSPIYLIGPPLTALLVDVTNQAHIAFYLPGNLCVLGGLLFLSILCIHKFNHQQYESLS